MNKHYFEKMMKVHTILCSVSMLVVLLYFLPLKQPQPRPGHLLMNSSPLFYNWIIRDRNQVWNFGGYMTYFLDARIVKDEPD